VCDSGFPSKLLLDTHTFLWAAAGREKLALRVVDITARPALRTEQLPFHHRDPFDRLLAGRARTEEMTLAAADDAFDGSGVKRLW